MNKMIRCECGVTIRGKDDDELVANAQKHANEAHGGIVMSREQILAMAQPTRRADERLPARQEELRDQRKEVNCMARAITCDCGETVVGKDDEELFRLGKQHMAQKHPDMKMTDEQMRGMIKAGAKNA